MISRLSTNKILLLLFVSSSLLKADFSSAPKAIVTVPVADVLNTSIYGVCPAKIEQMYAETTFVETNYNDREHILYERLYQLLFNETVRILEEKEYEYRICIPHIYCKPCENNPERLGGVTNYWILKNKVKKLSTIDVQKCQYIPPEINYKENNIKQANKNCVTLVQPFCDDVTGKIYSAGTRFVIKHAMDNAYVVYVLNYAKSKTHLIEIPKKYCAVRTKSLQEKIDQFVLLLQSYANMDNAFLPYVWGGASYTILANGPDVFHSVFWLQQKPFSGFDCTCLVSRAAQICNIEYYLGDSDTISERALPLKKEDVLQPGDLIWFPGHVVIVSDTNKNTIIEARGYNAGFGRIHEIELKRLFKDTTTFTALKQAYLAKKPLYLLHKNGTIRMEVETYKLIRFKDLCGPIEKMIVNKTI